MPTEPNVVHMDSIDRAAVMIEARRQFSIMGPLGWTFARCLSYSWTKLRR